MGTCVRSPPVLRLTALSLFLALPAFGLSAPQPCAETMKTVFVVNAAVTSVLVIPAAWGDDREVRLAAGAGASYRGDAAERVNVAWSMTARRRIGDSRFHYRAWSHSLIQAAPCPGDLEGNARLVAGLGADVLKTDLLTLELGLGLQQSFTSHGQSYELERFGIGGAPFVRLGIDPPDALVGFEVLAFYLLNLGSPQVLHGAMLDLSVLLRFSRLAAVATFRGELGTSEAALYLRGVTLPLLSGSVLLGIRL